jgi:hypothetical protein
MSAQQGLDMAHRLIRELLTVLHRGASTIQSQLVLEEMDEQGMKQSIPR